MTPHEVAMQTQTRLEKEVKDKVVELMVHMGSTNGLMPFESLGRKLVIVFGTPDAAKQILENIQ